MWGPVICCLVFAKLLTLDVLNRQPFSPLLSSVSNISCSHWKDLNVKIYAPRSTSLVSPIFFSSYFYFTSSIPLFSSPVSATWLLPRVGQSAGDPGRVDIHLLRVMYEMDKEGNGDEGREHSSNIQRHIKHLGCKKNQHLCPNLKHVAGLSCCLQGDFFSSSPELWQR